ncbi:MAG: diguanylate cyclase [Pseudomonadota bacterium]
MLAAQNNHPLTLAPAPDDRHRLAALQRYQGLDTAACGDFDFLTELAASVCGVPYAFISLVGAEHVSIKAFTGLALASLPREECYCSLAVLGQSATEIADLSLDPRTAAMPMTVGAPQMRMYSSVALTSPDGHAIGTLSVMDTRPGRLSGEQARLLRGLARQVMALFEARLHEQALNKARAELEALATTDPLTGLHNRRTLTQRLTFEVARTRRFRTPLSALMIRLDDVTALRRRHGDAALDQVLANVGRLLRENVRVIDVAGRYDADTLCVVLPNTPRDGAVTLAETLRGKIAAQIHRDAGRLLPVTASIGVGAFDQMEISDADSLLHQAGQALGRATSAGRNRVEC